jgi:cytochrome c oxidase assembly protein subunit 15
VPPSRDFQIAFRLGTATTVTLFGLIVLGSIVRTTGSGLACPDWPLCHGRLIPPFQFNVLIEWFHRLAALVATLLLVASAGWTLARPATRARLGGLALLAVTLIVIQILLGALTVWKLLDPGVVAGHLATALLVFSTVLLFTLAAGRAAAGEAERASPRPPLLLPLTAAATAGVFVQSVLGGMVSTHGAGLACPDWPTCYGEWLPPLEGAIGLQMAHRFGAYAATGLVLAAATIARPGPDPAVARVTLAALGFTVLQVVLGVCNVFLRTPPWLSAIHLATAVTVLALMLAATFHAAAAPAREPDWGGALPAR